MARQMVGDVPSGSYFECELCDSEETFYVELFDYGFTSTDEATAFLKKEFEDCMVVNVVMVDCETN